jgi:hypothetical protein
MTSGLARRRNAASALCVLLLLLALGLSGAQAAGNDVTYHGGPVLQSPTVYIVLWLPSGRHIEPSGNDATVQSRLGQVAQDLSGTHYLGVLTQYSASSQVRSRGLWVDLTPYPHAGTEADPLQASDYGDAVKRAMANNGWKPGLDKLYLVYTANGTEACGLSNISSGGHAPDYANSPQDCTFPDSDFNQCSGHTFLMQDGQPAAYAIIPLPAASGCLSHSGLPQDPNHDIPLDTALTDAALLIAATIVDPLGNAWYTGNPVTGELGCFSSDAIDDLNLNGRPLSVFSLYSNARHDCAFGYPAVTPRMSVKAKTRRPGETQAVTVKVEAGARVLLNITYANNVFAVRKGTAKGGAYHYTWKVPKIRGKVSLEASILTLDGGQGTARSSFRIR